MNEPPADADVQDAVGRNGADEVSRRRRAGEPGQRSSLRNLAEWAAILIGAIVVATVVKTFLIQAYYIPSLSMYPTLDKNHRVLVNKLSYDLHDVHREDLIVFRRPGDPSGAGGPCGAGAAPKELIKRVMAVGGDTIEARDGAVLVNHKAVDEPYTAGAVTTNLPKQTIPKGRVFVMGDNRTNSCDSRVFGAVDEDTIVGRAFVRIWPLSRFELF
ncbi:MAG: signal peptidase I [Actinobacteria bacterium]|nr:signal peptidase I [Actinomycetota bacterium]